jgi:hypothetical protein
LLSSTLERMTQSQEGIVYFSPFANKIAETGASLPEVQATLSMLASGLDDRFVQAGTALGTAFEIIERLVASLEGVTNALDREAADAAVENMRSTADHLNQLPAQQAHRQEDLGTVREASEVLHSHIGQINKILRFLHICGHNIKIAAAGADEFSGFADSMFERLELGEKQLASFEVEVCDLAGKISSVVDAERLLAAECAKVIPQVPLKLAKDAIALQRHQAELTTFASQIADMARLIRGKVGVALGALQIGDITRQRLEHVADGILTLTTFLNEQEAADTEMLMAVERHVLALLAAQATDAIEDFQREARLLTRSLQGLAPDAARLLALKEASALAGQAGEGQSFLHVLEQGIADVESVTRQLREADKHSDRLSLATSQTVESLIDRLKAVGKVQSDVQQMAWNTGLRCMRMEQQGGRGLAVISSEIRAFANHLEMVSGKIVQTFEQLTSAAGSIRERGAQAGRIDAGQALSESLANIRAGGRKMEESLSSLDGDASRVVAILRDTTDKVDCEAEIGVALSQAAAQLAVFARPDKAVPDAAAETLSDILGQIARSYTMARERDVHKRFVVGGAGEECAEIALAANDGSDDDLFDDALF